jgi:hypothetical protein
MYIEEDMGTLHRTVSHQRRAPAIRLGDMNDLLVSHRVFELSSRNNAQRWLASATFKLKSVA